MRRPTRDLLSRFSLVMALLAGPPSRADETPPRATSTVGMPAKIDQLVLPGTRARGQTDRGPPHAGRRPDRRRLSARVGVPL